MINYKGYQIDAAFRIFQNGKQYFTAWYQLNNTLDHAKQMIDASEEGNLRMKRLPSLSYNLKEEFENGTESRDDSDRWYSLNSEIQNKENERL